MLPQDLTIGNNFLNEHHFLRTQLSFDSLGNTQPFPARLRLFTKVFRGRHIVVVVSSDLKNGFGVECLLREPAILTTLFSLPREKGRAILSVLKESVRVLTRGDSSVDYAI